jgi:sarcosine oxidase subunit gamma
MIQIPTRTVIQLKSWMSGCISSAPVTFTAECRLLTLAPREWLLISDTLDAQILQKHALKIRPQGIAAVNLSAGLVAMRLEGRGVREVIANNCGLDLHPTKFPVCTVARTRLAQLPIIIDLIDAKPQFELYVGRSYVDYLCCWLNDAAARQGRPQAGGNVCSPNLSA